jgi:SSS family solute:Na+ symporter
MVLAALWAPQIENFASLFKYLQMVLSYTVPPVCAVYFLGAFWKGANAQGAWWAVICGTAAGALLFITNEVIGLTNLHFLYVGPILFVISIATLVISSRSDQPPRDDQIALVWTPQFYAIETQELKALPLWQNYRIWSVALLIVTGVLVYLFA